MVIIFGLITITAVTITTTTSSTTTTTNNKLNNNNHKKLGLCQFVLGFASLLLYFNILLKDIQ